jgi:hypothetical protein
MQFVYRHPARNLRLQATVTRVDSDDPAVLQDQDTLASDYVRNTRRNMPTFRAEDRGSVQGQDLCFRMVHREGPARAMLCGFAVRGNTTVIVSLIGVGKDKGLVEAYAPKFRKYLSESRLAAAGK